MRACPLPDEGEGSGNGQGEKEKGVETVGSEFTQSSPGHPGEGLKQQGAGSELREAFLETNKKTRECELPGLLFRCRLINQLTRQVSPLDNSFFKSPGPVLAFASSSCLLIAPS